MEVTEELKKELGNAIKAYSSVLTKAYLGISTPGFKELEGLLPSELQYKMQLLKDFYSQL